MHSFYGHLVQLSGDLAAAAIWRRVSLASAGGEPSIDEAALQEILFRHAHVLPLGEIDDAYSDAVPVCRELGTRAGSADALYLTPSGRIVLAEFKLWRNPEARREVIGQILDYARVLASWSYDDLDREVRRRTGGRSRCTTSVDAGCAAVNASFGSRPRPDALSLGSAVSTRVRQEKSIVNMTFCKSKFTSWPNRRSGRPPNPAETRVAD